MGVKKKKGTAEGRCRLARWNTSWMFIVTPPVTRFCRLRQERNTFMFPTWWSDPTMPPRREPETSHWRILEETKTQISFVFFSY